MQGIQALGKAGLCFDLCMRPDELADGAKLAEICPETKFVLDHCGNADPQAADIAQWKQDIALVSTRPNVVCKISGIVARAKPNDWKPADLAPIVERCVETFGHDRVIFGSDWPVCTERATLRQWVEALQEITRHWSEADRRKLFHDNAVHFYMLT